MDNIYTYMHVHDGNCMYSCKHDAMFRPCLWVLLIKETHFKPTDNQAGVKAWGTRLKGKLHEVSWMSILSPSRNV